MNISDTGIESTADALCINMVHLLYRQFISERDKAAKLLAQLKTDDFGYEDSIKMGELHGTVLAAVGSLNSMLLCINALEESAAKEGEVKGFRHSANKCLDDLKKLCAAEDALVDKFNSSLSCIKLSMESKAKKTESAAMENIGEDETPDDEPAPDSEGTVGHISFEFDDDMPEDLVHAILNNITPVITKTIKDYYGLENES